jgi:hypothetical protein
MNVFPIEGYCITKNKVILDYIKNNMIQQYVGPSCPGGIAWQENQWYPIKTTSTRPKFSEEELLERMNMEGYDPLKQPTISISHNKLRIRCQNLKKNLKL